MYVPVQIQGTLRVRESHFYTMGCHVSRAFAVTPEGAHGDLRGGAVDGDAFGADGVADAIASRGGPRERRVLDQDATLSRVARRASAVGTRF